MSQPVRCCRCGGIYDLGKVVVTARYADCSMWSAPCCGATVDDRGETGWKTIQDYERIDLKKPTRNPFISESGQIHTYSGRFPWEG